MKLPCYASDQLVRLLLLEFELSRRPFGMVNRDHVGFTPMGSLVCPEPRLIKFPSLLVDGFEFWGHVNLDVLHHSYPANPYSTTGRSGSRTIRKDTPACHLRQCMGTPAMWLNSHHFVFRISACSLATNKFARLRLKRTLISSFLSTTSHPFLIEGIRALTVRGKLLVKASWSAPSPGPARSACVHYAGRDEPLGGELPPR